MGGIESDIAMMKQEEIGEEKGNYP